MKKVLGALLIMVTMVVFTSNASAVEVTDNIEFVVSADNSSVAVAVVELLVVNGTINVADESANYTASAEGLIENVPIVNEQSINVIINVNVVASLEDLTEIVESANGILNDKLVINDNIASVEGLIKVFSLSDSNSNGTNFAETFLPIEVGLSNSNILNT